MPRITLGELGALVRERRGTRGVRETANEIQISPATLSRVENGKQPDLTTFEKLCRWLELDPADVLGIQVPSRSERAESRTTATAHFRAQRNLSPDMATALGELILRAQDLLLDEPSREG